MPADRLLLPTNVRSARTSSHTRLSTAGHPRVARQDRRDNGSTLAQPWYRRSAICTGMHGRRHARLSRGLLPPPPTPPVRVRTDRPPVPPLASGGRPPCEVQGAPPSLPRWRPPASAREALSVCALEPPARGSEKGSHTVPLTRSGRLASHSMWRPCVRYPERAPDARRLRLPSHAIFGELPPMMLAPPRGEGSKQVAGGDAFPSPPPSRQGLSGAPRADDGRPVTAASADGLRDPTAGQRQSRTLLGGPATTPHLSRVFSVRLSGGRSRCKWEPVSAISGSFVWAATLRATSMLLGFVRASCYGDGSGVVLFPVPRGLLVLPVPPIPNRPIPFLSRPPPCSPTNERGVW